ncbi:hypothetical protein TNCV_1842711 [Trichonephila clavipes]|nr:hypothetical protein TNCV_1842711 [Trichonephila clavipes]
MLERIMAKPWSRERSEGAGPLFGTHLWSANEVEGTAGKICGPPMRGGEGCEDDPPLEFKRVDSELEEKKTRYFRFLILLD